MQYTTFISSETLQIPIYRSDGRVIGQVQGGVFVKRISGSKHLLQKPPAIALSVESLAQAEQAGAKAIKVTDKDNGRVYSCTLEHFKRYSWELQRGGFERQRALALERWDVAGGKTPAVKPASTLGQAFERVINKPAQLALF